MGDIMGTTLIVILIIGTGIAYWIYRCQQKEECSIKGEAGIILKHLNQGRTITAEQAKKYYNIKHLRSVISRLRHFYSKDIQTVVNKGKAVYKKK
jgi:hypothetical protein